MSQRAVTTLLVFLLIVAMTSFVIRDKSNRDLDGSLWRTPIGRVAPAL